MSLRLTTVACVSILAACGDATTDPSNDEDGTGGFETGLAYAGVFHPVVHAGEGMVELYVLSGGAQELRFGADFRTDPGPRLEVWLVKSDDPMDSETVVQAEYVSLGPLRSATGEQTYGCSRRHPSRPVPVRRRLVCALRGELRHGSADAAVVGSRTGGSSAHIFDRVVHNVLVDVRDFAVPDTVRDD